MSKDPGRNGGPYISTYIMLYLHIHYVTFTHIYNVKAYKGSRSER